MSDVLIIGGGMAGMSAGIYSRMFGENTTICEKHLRSGGNLTGWIRGGHTIDNCIHWLTGTNPVTGLYKVWNDLGALGNVNVIRSSSLYTCTWGGQSLSLWRDFEKTIDEMLTISPRDCREILEFAKAVHTFRNIQKTAGENRSGRESTFKMLMGMPQLFKYHFVTTKQLSQKFHHPLLQLFFTSIMGDDFSALAFIMVAAVFTGGNGDIPEGGSIAMARRIEERYRSLGGKLLLNKSAEKINLNGDVAESVTFSDGETIRADYIIVSADPDTVFDGKMMDFPMPKELKKQYDSEEYMRFSSYHCAYSCDTDEVPFHGDLVVEIPPEMRHDLGASHMLVREFSHLENGSPEGKATLQTMTFIKEDACRKYLDLSQDRQAYLEHKNHLSEKVKKIIEDTCPALKDKLKSLDVWTPATYRRYTGAAIGSFMSFAMPPKRIPKTIDNRVRGLKNVLMASQWLQAPGGLPVAALSGKKAAEIVHELAKG